MKKKKIMRLITNILFGIGIFVILATISLRISFVQVVVNGSSMEPTLHGNNIDGYDVGYMIRPSLTKIHRFDIVAVKINEKENWVKRIIGLPKEKVELKEGKVYINDQLLEEPFTKIEDSHLNIPAFTLTDNQYFVIGDNRLHSDRKIIEKKQIFGINGFLYSKCMNYNEANGSVHRCSVRIKTL